MVFRFSFKLNINSCISFQSNYNPFQYTYKQDLFHYGSIHRRMIKQKHNLVGVVEDHHIIPRSLIKHPLIAETKFPIHCSKNIKMMPSVKNKMVDEDILVHCLHRKYNGFMKERLNQIYEESMDKQRDLILLLDEMNEKLNHKDQIPWN